MTMVMKVCSKCNCEKDISEFNLRLGKSISRCRICTKMEGNAWYLKNKDNSDFFGEDFRNKQKVYELINKEKIKKRKQEYYLKNKETISKRNSDYIKNNKELVRERNRNNKRKRMKTDYAFKMGCYLRTSVYRALKNNTHKPGSAIKDLGCTQLELVKYLESLFYSHPKTGQKMTWDNYGNGKGFWEIDHIYPVCVTDFSNKDDFLKLVNYRNLRPLWFEENRAKIAQDLKLKKERING